MSFVRQHKGAVLWSVALHVAVVATLSLGFEFAPRQRVAATAAPIQGMIVDQSVLTREQERRDQAARAERQRQQREERQRREAEQQRERDRQAAEQRARDQQREREQAAQQAREREAAEKRRQEQLARERTEREKAEREAAAKREREAAAARRAQQQAEEALQRDLAAEAERMSAERAGLMDEYILQIENKIERNWERPLSAKPGLDCIVNVVQAVTGDVLSVSVASCNGDDAVRRSIERAVEQASPLPRPPNPSLFERNLRVRFQPDS